MRVMMNVYDLPTSDFMSMPVIAIHPDAELVEAERQMEQTGVSCLAVVGARDELLGVISRTDILRVGRLRSQMGADAHLLTMPHQTVRQRMVADVVSVDPDTPLRAAAARMLEHRIHRVFVVDNGLAVGVLSTRDLMRAVMEERTQSPIGQWMSHPVIAVSATETLARATDRLGETHVRGVVVLEEEWPVGVFTQSEALGAADLDPMTPVEEVMSCALLCLPVGMPVFRAAAFAVETRARRVLAVEARELRGILSGLDMARVVADGTVARW